ncbi:hypothetical protein Indivirus_2_97 [Indivirus ILV1]|uniref:Uncharacterized protein n=1 Tax=Indivirus ILV1 TaxID=1977633 RepID=A0A1V0SDI9_9VIRU|nr:hypothetical protein Indivirus_2_97 [Indivirus ILV1]
MKLLGYELCTPALVYLIIAVVITLVAFLLNFSTEKILPFVLQLASIVACSIVLTFICGLGQEGKVGTTVSWVITGLFVCMTTLGLVGALTGTGGISTPVGNIGNSTVPQEGQ